MPTMRCPNCKSKRIKLGRPDYFGRKEKYCIDCACLIDVVV